MEDGRRDVAFERCRERFERGLHTLERPVEHHREGEWSALAHRHELFRGVDVAIPQPSKERGWEVEAFAVDVGIEIA